MEFSERHGPFNFFAVWLFGDDKLQVAFSYWASDAEEQAKRERAIRSALDSALGGALGSMMTAPRYFLPNDPQILAFYAILSFVGPIQHAIRANVSNNVVVGLPQMPAAWVITCANWDKGSVLKRLEELGAKGDTKDARI